MEEETLSPNVKKMVYKVKKRVEKKQPNKKLKKGKRALQLDNNQNKTERY